MKSMLGRARTALALLRYCAGSNLWWATPALALLLAAGVFGAFEQSAAGLIADQTR
jgi:hypothetical protein